jgi:diaminohydroxyphosphoribosylaminopyrimidine deaminase/5-amino-6-(5-phosphoribosylamino)uracil reductase
MNRCLELAVLGVGQVSPNPMVGSVIVVDGKIIAEGYHARFGQAHAEVHAISKVKDVLPLNQSTLYVNLEPCTHLGKTPPCVDAIVAARIPKVVVGMIDPSDKVAGRGVAALREKGIDVTVGVLEAECLELNRRFVTYHAKKRPYIILKWAQTADGFLARSDGTSKWISGEESRKLVHQWRTEEDAILVGTTTAVLDNPQLTVRHVKGRSPLRSVIDRSLKVPRSHNVYDAKAQTIIFTSKPATISEQVEHVAIDFNGDVVGQILQILYERNILSLIVEGGANTLMSFIDRNLWDEARVFTAPHNFESGLKAPLIDRHLLREEDVEVDRLKIFRESHA